MPTVTKRRKQAKAGEAKRQTKEKAKARIVLYAKIHGIFHGILGKPGITVALAKKLLGWEEETEKVTFGNKFLFKIGDRKIRCSNNVINRPLYQGNVDSLKQEILNERWKFNGEPIIIGRTGLVLNGQHTLIALILAAEDWADDKTKYPDWKTEPTLAKLIVFGIEEDDETVNTMDTCKPRSLADVIYRCHYFKGCTPEHQKKLARLCQSAIQQLWNHTGLSHQHAKQTHSESIDFLAKHWELVSAVRHVWEEDEQEGKLSRFIPLGVGAALLYLMAASDSVPDDYYTAETPSESKLDMGRWDKACQFFVDLAGGDAKLKSVAGAIDKLIESGDDHYQSRWAVLAKAWEAYKDAKPVTAKSVHLEFELDEESAKRRLVEMPLVGGIDIGNEGIIGPSNGDPTPADIAKAKTEIHAKRAKKAEAKNGKPEPVQKGEAKGNIVKSASKKKTIAVKAGPFKASRAGATWRKGDTAWVHCKGEPVFSAKLIDDPYMGPTNIERVEIQDANGVWEVDVAELSLFQKS